MRCAVVSSAVIARERRMDASHYLGREKKIRDEIVRAAQNLQNAQARLERAWAALQEDKARLERLGIVPFDA